MDTKTIRIKMLLISLGIVLVVELGGRGLVTGTDAHPLVCAGLVRLLEIVLLSVLFTRDDRGIGAIGLNLSSMPHGLYRGMVWSAGFGAVVLCAFAVMTVLNMTPLRMISAALPDDTLSIILLFAVGGVISPVAEEVLFRGIIYGYFRRWGFFCAIVVSTTVFVLLHSVTSPIPVTQIVGGMLFAIAYEAEKDLMVPITIHVLGNTAIFTLSLVLI